MDHIDKLVRQWGLEHFDYVLMHYDDSSSEWNKWVCVAWPTRRCVALSIHVRVSFFDPVCCIFSLYRFNWYKKVVAVTAQRQAKLWFYKRFATPWHVKVGTLFDRSLRVANSRAQKKTIADFRAPFPLSGVPVHSLCGFGRGLARGTALRPGRVRHLPA